MTNTTSKDLKLPLKKCWHVGENTVVVIDKTLVKKLELYGEDIKVQEQIVKDGIFLKIIRPDSQTDSNQLPSNQHDAN